MRIAIFGTTGAGKTTLINHLVKHLPSNYEVVSENFYNCPYFEEGYKKIENNEVDTKVNFNLDLYLFTERMKQFTSTFKSENIVYDRSLLDSIVFFETNYLAGYMDYKDFYWFEEYFEQVVLKSIKDKEKKPYDLVIYLKVDPSIAYGRILNRNRPEETLVPEEHWNLLSETYDKWFRVYEKNFPTFSVDGNINDPEIYTEIIINEINKLSN